MHRGAFQLTLEGALYGMINEGHVTLKTAERKANELLDSMENGPDGYDIVPRTNGDDNASNGLLNSTSRYAAGLDAAGETEGQRGTEVDEKNTPSAAVNSEQNESATWAAPRSRGDSDRPISNNSRGDPRSQQRATTSAGTTSVTFGDHILPMRQGVETLHHTNDLDHADDGHDASGILQVGRGLCPRSLGSCLDQALETHQRACTRYGNQVAELEGRNAALAARTAEATRLEAEAVSQTKVWEARYGELEGRLQAVEKRSREELMSAEERGEEERLRGVEAAELLRVTRETATATLLDMLTGYAPRDTEGFGVDLLRGLKIEPDLYVHVLETKRMFQVRSLCVWCREGCVQR